MKSSLVKAYFLRHGFEVRDLIDAYYGILTRILDELWNSLTWTRKGKRLISCVRKDKPFRKSLRDECLADWAYSKHYVDSAIRQAYSMMKSWRKLYLKGRAGKVKPILKRKFVRIKETLYSCRDGVLKVSIKPFERSITIDLKRTWLWERIRGLELGELILKEDVLIVTVRGNVELKVENPMAWDSNLLMLNGYDGARDCEVSLKKNIYGA